MPKENKSELYSGMVWILSAISLLIYGTMGILETKVPGVEELVRFLSTVDGTYIYLAAFIAIFIEGLYFVGSFFPGTTLIIILTILSQIGGISVFLVTILTIFLGWCCSSVVNLTLAKLYYKKLIKTENTLEYEVKDRLLTTWFPVFRANYEVSQIVAGGNYFKVFFSSVRVKFLASSGAALVALLIPLFVDIHQVSNKEGFFSISVVASVCFTVGIIRLRKYFRKNDQVIE